MPKNKWILSPICGSKTRDRLREDTVLKNYPLCCPKCKQETLINVRELHITVNKEPNAKTQKSGMYLCVECNGFVRKIVLTE